MIIKLNQFFYEYLENLILPTVIKQINNKYDFKESFDFYGWLRNIKRGLSQENFAANAQLGRSYAGRVERGEQNISMQSLIQIAITLEVEPSELLPTLKGLKAPYRKRLDK